MGCSWPKCYRELQGMLCQHFWRSNNCHSISYTELSARVIINHRACELTRLCIEPYWFLSVSYILFLLQVLVLLAHWWQVKSTIQNCLNQRWPDWLWGTPTESQVFCCAINSMPGTLNVWKRVPIMVNRPWHYWKLEWRISLEVISDTWLCESETNLLCIMHACCLLCSKTMLLASFQERLQINPTLFCSSLTVQDTMFNQWDSIPCLTQTFV